MTTARPKWAQELRKARMAAGLTQKEAATSAGITERTWQSYEYGHTKPRPLFLTAIMTKLGVV